ncbi:hypothetical protein CAL29_31265 [Bordetella genomosp. 10]|uniref:Uncharacterized protein n=1 Tax=Bordetella genomosp. 10 TaxID=1416804 RepID=A0A261S782_9BORD|nr:hypothetical protein [Bordetella genomosp. 10]OZI32293.1 hypothetical protein CAL29_31265 [Bordetella genomosp. 10]
MSWRVLFAALLLALGASALGGVQFGDWLVAHAPASSPSTEEAALVPPPARDGHGARLPSQPPQPLMNGMLGVPETPAATDWHVSRKASLFNGPRDPLVQISRNAIDLAQARRIAAEIQAARAEDMENADGAEGVADLGSSDSANAARADEAYTRLHATRGVAAQAALQTLDALSERMTAMPAATPTESPLLAAVAQSPAAAPADWRDALRSELAQCASLGFFDRPTCSWTARNKYCGPNKAWGTMRECPRKVE